MTANGEVANKRRKRQNMSNNWIELSNLCFLKKFPADLFLGKLCEDRGYTYHCTRGQKPHLTRNGTKIDCKNIKLRSICGSWFISEFFFDYTFNQFLHHLHHKIPYLMSTDTLKIQYQKEVEVRVKSFGEIRCMNPQKPKTKNGESEDVQRDILHELLDWLQEFRENLVDESIWTEPWQNQSQEFKTLPSHLMNCQWCREQKWNWVRVSTVYIRIFRRTQTVIST